VSTEARTRLPIRAKVPSKTPLEVQWSESGLEGPKHIRIIAGRIQDFLPEMHFGAILTSPWQGRLQKNCFRRL
jgi:hypothetical protein